MTSTIAFVGAGPTTLYTLQALLDADPGPIALTIFEEQATAGRGTPYRPGWNDPAMLANIASIEISPLADTLLGWLERQPEARLRALGVDPEDLGERVFYPRLALGAYLEDQFHALLDRAAAQGVRVALRTHARVVDVSAQGDALVLTVKPRHDRAYREPFDHVVLATGHQWPAEPEVRPGYFVCPWPASALSTIPPCETGIRGTSLSAIDAAVALATRNGRFHEERDGALTYVPEPATDAFRMTMMSRKGLLPEADFYHPLPYEPLALCTPEAMEALIADPADDLLERAFALFKRELAAADPGYARTIGLDDLALEDFCDAYFAARLGVDPFVWAETNLREAQRNHDRRFTVAWRYAILRMHEVIALIVPHLDQQDFARFSRHFKPVFVDDYATVPHDSIRRMLALHRAGKLEILAIGDDYRIDSHQPERGAILQGAGERRSFPAFIEATGQRPLAARDLPFPSLLRQGLVQDIAAAEPGQPIRGILVDDQFHPVADEVPADRLFCLSLPYLLGRHPFIQGITSSHEMGQVVGAELAAAVRRVITAPRDAEFGTKAA